MENSVMENNIAQQVKTLLANYIDIDPDSLDMDADLDLAYEVDSTEMTELAKSIENEFAITISKFERQHWQNGNDICKFVQSKLSN